MPSPSAATSVRAFVEHFLASGRSVEIVINNAAIMACPETRVGPGWEAQFAVENAFDRRYETAAFYRQPGRGYFFTLRYRRSP